MTQPPSASCGASACTSQNGPSTFVAKVRSSCSGAKSASSSWAIWNAALHTSTSTPPSSATARSASSWLACGVRRSAACSTTRVPAPASSAVARASDSSSGRWVMSDLGALTRERDGDGPADAGVAAGDDRALATQPVAPGPRLGAVVRRRSEVGVAARATPAAGRERRPGAGSWGSSRCWGGRAGALAVGLRSPTGGRRPTRWRGAPFASPGDHDGRCSRRSAVDAGSCAGVILGNGRGVSAPLVRCRQRGE